MASKTPENVMLPSILGGKHRPLDAIRVELEDAKREYRRMAGTWFDADGPVPSRPRDEGEAAEQFARMRLALKPQSEKIARLSSELSIAEVNEAITQTMQIVQSRSASNAAIASHKKHNDNRDKARAWYAAHKMMANNKTMSKDDAAVKMHDDKIIAAAVRTIRGYLTNQ